MGSSSPPPAPDPAATAAAQTASNQQTAQYQASLNNVNQVTPQGNLTYSYDMNGPNGAPQYTATQTLSPQEQTLFNLGNQTQQSIAQTGLNQANAVGTQLSKPLDLSPGAVESNLTDLGLQRLQPILDQNWQTTESNLMNRGIMPGSKQYQLAQTANSQAQNDAYNQLILGGYGQETANMQAQYNSPINAITALLSGSQVSQPNYTNTPQTQVQPTNVAGITQNSYQDQLQGYGLQQQQNNAMLGGLFGLAAAPLGGWASGGFKGISNRSAKKDIREVGRLHNGLPIYAFKYMAGGPTQLGVMADEVEKVKPLAVSSEGVDYDMAVS
jgi:hypothetical protein